MRQLKFRCWDKTTGLMLYPRYKIGFEQLLSDKMHIKHGSAASKMGGSLDFMYRSGCPTMQFTGLMDKNGKDVYECDIVRMHNSMGRFLLAEVRIVDGCSEIYIPTLQQRDCLKCYTCNHAVEIIGNVHENPEMLA